jgi:hypothetical protein
VGSVETQSRSAYILDNDKMVNRKLTILAINMLGFQSEYLIAFAHMVASHLLPLFETVDLKVKQGPMDRPDLAQFNWKDAFAARGSEFMEKHSLVPAAEESLRTFKLVLKERGVDEISEIKAAFMKLFFIDVTLVAVLILHMHHYGLDPLLLQYTDEERLERQVQGAQTILESGGSVAFTGDEDMIAEAHRRIKENMRTPKKKAH